jgi:hypothetical protein
MRIAWAMLMAGTLACLAAAGPDAPPIAPPPSAAAVPAPVRWAVRSWAGDRWDNDVSQDVPVTPLDGGGWRFVNNWKESKVVHAVALNLSAADAPVEVILRAPREVTVGVGACSAKGEDAFWHAWVPGTGEWTTVLLGAPKGRPQVAIRGRPAPVIRKMKSTDIHRPFLWLPQSAQVEVRSIRVLEAGEPVISPEWTRTPSLPPCAPVPAEWRLRGLSGGVWEADLARNASVERQEDNSWLVTNRDAPGPAMAVLAQLDARKGAVEIEIKAPEAGVMAGLTSASGENAWCAMPVFERNTWVRIRLSVAGHRVYVDVDGRRELGDTLGAILTGEFTAGDVHRPFILVPRSSSAQVRNIGQVRAK